MKDPEKTADTVSALISEMAKKQAPLPDGHIEFCRKAAFDSMVSMDSGDSGTNVYPDRGLMLRCFTVWAFGVLTMLDSQIRIGNMTPGPKKDEAAAALNDLIARVSDCMAYVVTTAYRHGYMDGRMDAVEKHSGKDN